MSDDLTPAALPNRILANSGIDGNAGMGTVGLKTTEAIARAGLGDIGSGMRKSIAPTTSPEREATTRIAYWDARFQPPSRMMALATIQYGWRASAYRPGNGRYEKEMALTVDAT